MPQAEFTSAEDVQSLGSPRGEALWGEFGADMQVASVNDGPVTILFDTEKP